MTTEQATPPSRTPIDNVRLATFTPMAVRAAMQLGLFTSLAQGPRTAEELATALGVKSRRLKALLYQLVVSEFLDVNESRFSNTEMAAYYLVEGTPNYAGNIHDMWTETFNAMMHTAESIRTDKAQTKMDFSGMSQEELSGFLKGLHGGAIAAGRSLSKLPKFADARKLIDVGGGSGGLAIALCKEHPLLHATIVDLPSVVPIAAQMVKESGLADRISVTTEDILNNPLKGEFDIATARAFFQVLSVDQSRKAAQNIGASLVNGATLFILGMVTDDSHLSPITSVGMNLIFLNMFDDGQAYTESEYLNWLTDAGFTDVSREPHIMGFDLISARKA